MRVAVVGATGLVGGMILKVLEERNFPVTELIPVASEKSVGKDVIFKGTMYKVQSMSKGVELRPDVALFSAGGNTSLEWAPKFAEAGTTVIDNSSAWRMHPDKKLVVPEINGDALIASDKIIANPNCSTIQMVLALNPLHKRFRIKRIIVSTYQAVSGTGKKAVDQLMAERKGVEGVKVYPHPIDLNIIPQVDVFLDNDYTKEEMKMVNETKKILRDDSILLTATCVRVPVIAGHSESVNIEFEKDFSVDEVKSILSLTSGVKVVDDTKKGLYPVPIHAANSDDTFVGRIRRDESHPRALNMWIVSDNLRKGAATNAVQIAEYLVAKKLL
jgi:aspartate-semialdehyde dehydrogenase